MDELGSLILLLLLLLPWLVVLDDDCDCTEFELTDEGRNWTFKERLL